MLEGVEGLIVCNGYKDREFNRKGIKGYTYLEENAPMSPIKS